MARKDSRSTSFVRSWDTDVPVSRTAAAMEEMIRRYGASGYTRSEDYASGRVLVEFTIAARSIRVLVDVPTVERKLLAMDEFKSAKQRRAWGAAQEEWSRAQAERVAWRHLLLYVEASLNAVSAGLLTLEEAFFAHALIETPAGPQRASDVALAAEAHAKQIGAGSPLKVEEA